jgi:hypothetical protein
MTEAQMFKKIRHFLWTAEFYYQLTNNPLGSILNQFNSVHIITPCSFANVFMHVY